MQITTLRMSNFQSFGPAPTSIELGDVIYLLGPNGAGKTVVLEGLSRLFSPLVSQRTVRREDFHIALTAPDLDEDLPTLWLEVDLEFPEAGDEDPHAAVPPFFAHMSIDAEGSVPSVRIRLTASLALDGEIDEKIEYVLEVDDKGEPTQTAEMSRYDRSQIETHYLPARRDPGEHMAYTTASLLGRTLRAADWTGQRDILTDLSTQITDALSANGTVTSIGERLEKEWSALHRGTFFKDPALTFGQGELESVLRQLTVTFLPSHTGSPIAYERLSDGQKSLLYISLVLAWQSMARRVLIGLDTSLDRDRLRPPVHLIIALEEPENSLAPHYLGRIVRRLRDACGFGDAQALIATHAPALLKRVEPESIRFLRLNNERETAVHRIVLPEKDSDAAKYVREAVLAYPELYFSRLVILGEGDSELIVLPRVLAAAGIAEDDASVAVVPLGGRHVNHFWRLLNELRIPSVTLLDLDCGRYQAGWGRVHNALKQVNAIRPGTFDPAKIAALPKWDQPIDFPLYANGKGAIFVLEQQGVFFSEPVDLDLMLMVAFPEAYGVEPATPDEKVIVSVLGKNHVNEDRLPEQVLNLFDSYHAKFDLQSKPATHLGAMANLSDEDLISGLPQVLQRMLERIRQDLAGLPE
ncbi:AAA family ATPase [Kribbella sp. NPDC051718]|uniref:ATP-dependent nuclease n=1 Tax=Kribbella sp. NPDC051718 TaxID=3155168 RepID=UPI00343840AC